MMEPVIAVSNLILVARRGLKIRESATGFIEKGNVVLVAEAGTGVSVTYLKESAEEGTIDFVLEPKHFFGQAPILIQKLAYFDIYKVRDPGFRNLKKFAVEKNPLILNKLIDIIDLIGSLYLEETIDETTYDEFENKINKISKIIALAESSIFGGEEKTANTMAIKLMADFVKELQDKCLI